MAKYERCEVCLQSAYPKIRYKPFKKSQPESSIKQDDLNLRQVINYTIYDRKHHMCPLDAKLSYMEGLYISGYINKVPVEDIGPITFSEWRMSSNINGNITVTTALGTYQLLKPSTSYQATSNVFYDRAYFSLKLVNYIKSSTNIEFEPLWKKCYELKIFRLILNKDYTRTVRNSMNCIHHEIAKLDTEKEMEFVTNCFKWLFSNDRVEVSSPPASTTVVKKIFEQLYTKLQDDETTDNYKCGVCEGCTIIDCGECKYCRDMVKFGGKGDSGKDCIHRNCSRCPPELDGNYEGDKDTTESEVQEEQHNRASSLEQVKVDQTEKDVKCIGEPIKNEGDKIYFKAVKVDQHVIKIGDFVTVVPKQGPNADYIVKIAYLWQVKSKDDKESVFFHGQLFMRSCDTVLGAIGDPNEVFLIEDICTHGTSVESIRDLVSVTENINPRAKNNKDGNVFYYKMFYDRLFGRFECLPADPACPNALIRHRYCPSCARNAISDKKNTPQLCNKIKDSKIKTTKLYFSLYRTIKWKGLEYTKGKGVFLIPGTFSQTDNLHHRDSLVTDSSPVHDPYRSEFYRRTETEHNGSNKDTFAPFSIGCINEIYTNRNGCFLDVNVMYRPENTRGFPQKLDVNLLYWSDEVQAVPLRAIVGPCHLFYVKNIPVTGEADRLRWFEDDPSRFYFRAAYNKDDETRVHVPKDATRIGEQPCVPAYRPMKCLDLYSGCGGLSEGLRQAGVAECQWAIDNDVSAAMSYEMNHRGAKVFTEDCNTVLERLVRGEKLSLQGVPYPTKGQVELLCGGPPWQGHSTMNRCNSSDNSLNNNSQIATFLSFCEFYKPNYIIMENVKNFVLYKGGLVLKLSMRALLDMKYQCTFGVLQAGQYGVPQARERLILLAAAPGFALPMLPKPSNVFNQRNCQKSISIDKKRYLSHYGLFLTPFSAPRRAFTVEDAISDLPTLHNVTKIYRRHAMVPVGYYQKLMRNGKRNMGPLREHMYKKVNQLVNMRISLVPTEPGADWRCIPNIVQTLSDGSQTAILKYTVDDKKNGKTSDGELRGVCSCVNGSPCDPSSIQKNTLIPWCLVHTANKNNNWAGLYGRLDWRGYFSTTVTDPEPIGRQGRLLHPSEHRILSIRESARSQGIPDSYLLFGTMRDKYRQIGSAVPPPVAAAIGRELKTVERDY